MIKKYDILLLLITTLKLGYGDLPRRNNEDLNCIIKKIRREEEIANKNIRKVVEEDRNIHDPLSRHNNILLSFRFHTVIYIVSVLFMHSNEMLNY